MSVNVLLPANFYISRKTLQKRAYYCILIFRRTDVRYPFTAPMVRPDTKYFWKKG